MQNWQEYRKLFPHTDHTVYLNHAAVAPMNRRVMEATRIYQQKRSEENIPYWPDLMEARNRFKELVGKLINAPVEYIARVENTTAGLNILAQGIDWKPGDRILLNNFEFPANVYSFLNLERLGVKVDFVKQDQGRIHLEDLVRAIRPETRLLAISFVQFLNGFRSDLKAISEICRQHDLLFSVDGIQGVGALEIDVQEMGIDFLANGVHKWLMSPMGTGFIYISPRIFDLVYPTNAGWLSVEDSWEGIFDYKLDFLPTAQRFEPSGFNVQGLVGANASLEIFLEIGMKHIQERILKLTDYLIDQLEAFGYKLFTISDPVHRSGIVTFCHDRAEELFEFLISNRTYVSLRSGMIRVSPHFYNTTEDIDRFMAVIREFDLKS